MNQLFISRNDLTDPAVVNFNSDVSFPYFSLHEIGGKIFSFCMNLDKRFYEFKYEYNPLFTYRYLIYGSIFLLAFLLISLIGLFYQRLIKLRYDAEKQIQHNQLRSIELQLNPHFILNILNSIGALYEMKEVKSARIYMGKYSKLLRDTLLSSGQIATTLKAELEFVRNYLELEKFRLNNRFQYAIENSCETESIEIPRLLLFTFVENALKHGLYPILESGEAFLEIICNSDEDAFRVEIKDNGIGIIKAKEMKNRSTGKGLKILEETLKLYDKIYHRKISFSTYDILPKQENTGTGIVLTIPKS
jgi:sensor histidine kinase YesM